MCTVYHTLANTDPLFSLNECISLGSFIVNYYIRNTIFEAKL